MAKLGDAYWTKWQFGVKSELFQGVRSQNRREIAHDKIEFCADLRVKNRRDTAPAGKRLGVDFAAAKTISAIAVGLSAGA